MNKTTVPYFYLLLIAVLCITCVKKYEPPAIQAANSYLVIDGFINAGPDQATTIVLSRSRNLSDTVSNIPELNAQVSVVSNAGNSYALTDANNTGNYSSALLNLSIANQYQLKITTSDGHQYASDFVPVKISPPIDSLTWQQDSSLTVYLNTHDPNNNTVYYKWDFTETWEIHSPVETFWVNDNGLIKFADTTNQTDSCWTTLHSTSITLGTSVALSQDVINKAPITTIAQNDQRIQDRYSILVRQIPLTADAYNYWLLVQKNSQQLGTLFDPQPSQLNGNIHPLTNPNEPVIGYLTAAIAKQQRIFITNNELTNWLGFITSGECQTLQIPTDANNYLIYTYPDLSYAPWYFTGNYPIYILVIIKKACVDCEEYGGVDTRPSFW